jgi:hypothetical protein
MANKADNEYQAIVGRLWRQQILGEDKTPQYMQAA